jgi:DNA-binding FadR family transcriptional regulator
MDKKNLFTKPVEKRTLAEQMADTIKEFILDGNLQSGDVLPTEPELCEQFGVSRAVVRDATRILMALGLVEVRHGSGVFVTESQTAAFGEALLIALRRAGASAWDVEQFEQIILPEVIALAAVMANEDEIAQLREQINDYEQLVLAYHQRRSEGIPANYAENQALLNGSQQIIQSIFNASHNRVFQQLAQPLMRLRNLRNWQDDDNDTPESLTATETQYFSRLADAIASRNPEQAREMVHQQMGLPPAAVDAMKETPVGEAPQIPISLSDLYTYLKKDR